MSQILVGQTWILWATSGLEPGFYDNEKCGDLNCQRRLLLHASQVTPGIKVLLIGNTWLSRFPLAILLAPSLPFWAVQLLRFAKAEELLFAYALPCQWRDTGRQEKEVLHRHNLREGSASATSWVSRLVVIANGVTRSCSIIKSRVGFGAFPQGAVPP